MHHYFVILLMVYLKWTAGQAVPSSLMQNWDILSDAEKNAAKVLCDAGQEHLFKNWPAPGTKDEEKHRFLAQASDLDSKYPGGIQRYVDNAKKLLKASAEGVNPFEGFTPSVPTGETLHFNTKELDEAEKLGMEAIPYTSFVLVAGGLGERLGYNHIKIALPVDVISKNSFIQHYVEFILAYQDRARAMTGKPDLILPLAIMTSDDTHSKTVELMSTYSFFGMEESQVTIVKQDKVPALMDNDAHFVLADNDPFSIVTKPHGHGDVHTLLHQHHVVENWIKNHGTRYVFFFQDTNGAVFRAFPAALGMSVKRGFEVNSLSVPRKAGEAVGAICTLKSEKQTLTINVEYNQLDPLLRATYNPQGDVADLKTGYSPFPGNINALIFAAQPYNEILNKCGGSVPEFCNPKYADSTKTKFKSPTRLECMMQDYPRLLAPTAKVGFTQIDRFMTFTAVKNNLSDGLAKHKSTGFSETAGAAESDLYCLNLALLQLGGSKIVAQGGKRFVEFAGIPVIAGPRISLAPSFGVTQQEIRDALKDSEIEITERSSLLLKGRGTCRIEKIYLDGALAVDTVEGSACVLKFVKEVNAGMELKPVNSEDKNTEERFLIRGYQPVIHAQRVILCSKPGDHKVINDLAA